MPAVSPAAAIRAARPPKEAVDPWTPLGVEREEEPEPGAPGRTVTTATVFLAGAECPFTCAFCDLWRYTLDGPTPPGAIPAQIRAAWGEIAPSEALPGVLKLYNASNFFEPRAVPPADDRAIVDLVSEVPRIVVENHPRLLGPRCFEFAAALADRGSRLEVAMGLETVQTEVFPRLNKGMELEDFAHAAERLCAAGLGVRAFVLLGTPWTAAEEAADRAAESAAWAWEHGAELVALIPLRGGNGTIDRLAATGDVPAIDASTALAALSTSLDAAQAWAAAEPGRQRPAVVLDPWDLDRLAGGDDPRVRRRIERMNRQQSARA